MDACGKARKCRPFGHHEVAQLLVEPLERNVEPPHCIHPPTKDGVSSLGDESARRRGPRREHIADVAAIVESDDLLMVDPSCSTEPVTAEVPRYPQARLKVRAPFAGEALEPNSGLDAQPIPQRILRGNVGARFGDELPLFL